MTDTRIATVTEVLREAGAQAPMDDTDTLATKVVNALDRGHGTPTDEAEAEAAGDPVARAEALASGGGANPETPVGTGTEGGTAAGTE